MQGKKNLGKPNFGAVVLATRGGRSGAGKLRGLGFMLKF